MKLKQKDLPRLREELLKQQRGMCALCGTSLKKSEAQLDHCHTTGYCRAAVHRECNIMLGKMENFIKRYGKKFKDNPVMLQGFCFNVFNYMRQDYSHLPLHPKHTLPEEREIRKLRKAIKNAKREETKRKHRKRIKTLREKLGRAGQ